MNPYQQLNIDPTATDSEIKTAYRKLAQKNHPDKGGDQEEFQAIQEAYEILSDPDRRKRYDETGETEKEKQPADRVAAALAGLFTEIITNDNFKGNIVEDIRKRVNEQMQVANHRVLIIEDEKSRLEKLSGRVKTEKSNYFQYAIDHKLSELDFVLERIKDENELRNLILENLDDYVDERPDKEPVFVGTGPLGGLGGFHQQNGFYRP